MSEPDSTFNVGFAIDPRTGRRSVTLHLDSDVFVMTSKEARTRAAMLKPGIAIDPTIGRLIDDLEAMAETIDRANGGLDS